MAEEQFRLSNDDLKYKMDNKFRGNLIITTDVEDLTKESGKIKIFKEGFKNLGFPITEPISGYYSDPKNIRNLIHDDYKETDCALMVVLSTINNINHHEEDYLVPFYSKNDEDNNHSLKYKPRIVLFIYKDDMMQTDSIPNGYSKYADMLLIQLIVSDIGEVLTQIATWANDITTERYIYDDIIRIQRLNKLKKFNVSTTLTRRLFYKKTTAKEKEIDPNKENNEILRPHIKRLIIRSSKSEDAKDFCEKYKLKEIEAKLSKNPSAIIPDTNNLIDLCWEKLKNLKNVK